MTGISVGTKPSSMPVNCGMEGMHGNASLTKKETGHQHTEAAHQKHQMEKIPDQYRGNTIDIKI